MDERKESKSMAMRLKFKQTPNDRGQQTKEPSIAVIDVNAQIRSQLFSIFIDSYNPSVPTGQVSFRFKNTSNLLEAFPSMVDGKNSQLLDRATSSLASVFVGKKFNNGQMVHHGVALYNQAIHSFSRLISRRGLPVREILCANVVFQYYEVGSNRPLMTPTIFLTDTDDKLHVRLCRMDGTYARRQCRCRSIWKVLGWRPCVHPATSSAQTCKCGRFLISAFPTSNY